MKIDAMQQRDMLKQNKQKHIADWICFNCGKIGHMAKNCWLEKGYPRKQRINVAIKGCEGYQGPQQINIMTKSNIMTRAESEPLSVEGQSWEA